jgi:hypothetical protein
MRVSCAAPSHGAAAAFGHLGGEGSRTSCARGRWRGLAPRVGPTPRGACAGLAACAGCAPRAEPPSGQGQQRPAPRPAAARTSEHRRHAEHAEHARGRAAGRPSAVACAARAGARRSSKSRHQRRRPTVRLRAQRRSKARVARAVQRGPASPGQGERFAALAQLLAHPQRAWRGGSCAAPRPQRASRSGNALLQALPGVLPVAVPQRPAGTGQAGRRTAAAISRRRGRCQSGWRTPRRAQQVELPGARVVQHPLVPAVVQRLPGAAQLRGASAGLTLPSAPATRPGAGGRPAGADALGRHRGGGVGALPAWPGCQYSAQAWAWLCRTTWKPSIGAGRRPGSR